MIIITPPVDAMFEVDIVTSQIHETTFEYYSDAVLGVAFLATAIIAAKR